MITTTDATSSGTDLTWRSVYLMKRSRVVLPDVGKGDLDQNREVVATINRNLEAIGFTLSPAVMERLLTLPVGFIFAFYDDILPVLRRMVGSHRRFSPMYPNFPAQVMEAHDLELYWNAITHYWSAFIADETGVPEVISLPRYETLARPAPSKKKPVELRVIDLGSIDDLERIFTRLVASNSSLSETDKGVVRWFIGHFRHDIQRLLPPSIPQKETIALLVGSFISVVGEEPACLLPHVRTATDVLRIASALSPGGDVSLAKPTKFRAFRRKERRFLLRALEGCGEIVEDMLRHPEMWKRLGHALHPGEWASRYPRALEAFDVVRNGKPFETFNSSVEARISRGRIDEAVALLRTRPGVFARRLDHLLRLASGDTCIARSFLDVADRVSTPVLLQVFHHFKTRGTREGRPRAFFPKGSVAKVQVTDIPLPRLPDGIAEYVTSGVRSVLVGRFAELPPLDKVYIDDSLRQQIVPFAQRSSSKSLRTIARGSRMPLPDGDVVRFFLWWKDGQSRTDIDLSATLFNADWRRMMDVSYYNLRGDGFAHSGDITSARNGACEFIDIDVSAVIERGIRYVGMVLYSFTQQNFCDLPECFAGWMSREAICVDGHGNAVAQSGEIFDPRTVRDKVDLAAPSTVGIPVVIDLVDRQVIWSDISLTSFSSCNNGATNSDRVSQMCRAIADIDRPNLHDLFSMHAESRGQLVPREEAETIFSTHEGVTPYDIDVIMSEYLA